MWYYISGNRVCSYRQSEDSHTHNKYIPSTEKNLDHKKTSTKKIQNFWGYKFRRLDQSFILIHISILYYCIQMRYNVIYPTQQTALKSEGRWGSCAISSAGRELGGSKISRRWIAASGGRYACWIPYGSSAWVKKT